METTKEEQRKHLRVKTHIPVRFRKLRDGASSVGVCSISKNLSEGGIRFRTDGFVSRACRLIVELDIPMFTKPVKAISKVAWIRKTDSGNEYEVGNRFLEMSKEDQELISEYISSFSLHDNSEEVVAQVEGNSKTEDSGDATVETV